MKKFWFKFMSFLKKRKWINKRGSASIEAAIVLPTVIVVIVSVILIIGFMYSQVEGNVRCHLKLIAAIGEENKNTTLHGKIPEGVVIRKGSGLLIVRFSGKSLIEFKEGGLIKKEEDVYGQASGYGFAPKQYIRVKDFISPENQ